MSIPDQPASLPPELINANRENLDQRLAGGRPGLSTPTAFPALAQTAHLARPCCYGCCQQLFWDIFSTSRCWPYSTWS
jgi:hypothetical protein